MDKSQQYTFCYLKCVYVSLVIHLYGFFPLLKILLLADAKTKICHFYGAFTETIL